MDNLLCDESSSLLHRELGLSKPHAALRSRGVRCVEACATEMAPAGNTDPVGRRE